MTELFVKVLEIPPVNSAALNTPAVNVDCDAAWAWQSPTMIVSFNHPAPLGEESPASYQPPGTHERERKRRSCDPPRGDYAAVGGPFGEHGGWDSGGDSTPLRCRWRRAVEHGGARERA